MNCYAEELIDDVQLVEKVRENDGGKFTGVRFYLEGPAGLHHRQNGHDDRSAVTFWGNTHSLRTIFLHALDKLGGLSMLVPTSPKTATLPGYSQIPLTERQKEVARLLALGLTSKEVAAQLSIAVKTADTHRANIMSRLKFHSITDLVYYAIREGLVQAEECDNAKANPRQGKIRGVDQESHGTA